MGAEKARFPRRRLILGVGAAFAVASIDGTGQSKAEAAVRLPAQSQGQRSAAIMSEQSRLGTAHFQADGGINNAYLVDQLKFMGRSGTVSTIAPA